MKIMLDVSPGKLKKCSEIYDYEFWQLRTPLRPNKIADVPYAIDNGCFSEFKEKEWLKMLEEAHAEERLEKRPLWVTAPDIVGCAGRTLDLFNAFKRKIYPLPIALVLQDGIKYHRIPYDEISAVFVGGSDTFKTSDEAMNACKAAKMLGKMVHVGRVNSTQRAMYWKGIADTCDGSGMSRFSDTVHDTHVNNVLLAIRNDTPQAAFEYSH